MIKCAKETDLARGERKRQQAAERRCVRARAAHDRVASQSGSGAVCVRGRGRLLLLLERSVQEQRRELVERQPYAGRAAYKQVDTAEVKKKRDGQDRTSTTHR